MKISEVILEDKKIRRNSIRIPHAEDLVFFEGSDGALRALSSIQSLFKTKDTLSIKWDGSVAIIFGRDNAGNFILTDKHGFVARGYDGLYKSASEFSRQKRKKQVDERYLSKISKFWKIAENAVPSSFRGFVGGDVMWFPGEMQNTGSHYTFTPNTVTYEVDMESDLGKCISTARAGYAAHTFYATTTSIGVPIDNVDDLHTNQELCILGPQIKNKATLQIDKSQLQKILKFIKANKKNIDEFLNRDNLLPARLLGVPTLLYTFVGSQITKMDLSLSVEKFLPWVQSNPALTKKMVARVSKYVHDNRQGIDAIFTTFELITDLKLDLIYQLDIYDGPIIAHIGGARGGEGYVNYTKGGPIKLVNRLGFSAANFENNRK